MPGVLQSIRSKELNMTEGLENHHLGVELQSHDKYVFNFLRNCQTFLSSAESFFILFSSVQ